MPYIGQGLTEGRRRAYNFVATGSQTTFLATYDVGSVSYTHLTLPTNREV